MQSDDSTDRLARLTERAGNGDRQALEALLVEHLPRLQAFVRHRVTKTLRAHEDSADVVQSVCREVLLHAGRFRFANDGAFRQWLFVEALRKMGKRARHHRASKRDAALRTDAVGLPDDSASEIPLGTELTTPSDVAEAREQLALLEGALEQLAAEQREVVTLAYVAGLSRAEIGAAIGKSEGAVRVILHRALTRIATLLETGPG
jgi:RNA polymerase sigma-70 factor (ECF subfamily)